MSTKNKLLVIEGVALSVVGGLLYLSRRDKDEWMKKKDNAQKYYDTTYRWMMNESEGMQLDAVLRDRGWSNIAIYGYGKLGELLYRKLHDSSVTVAYIADMNKLLPLDPDIDVPTYTPDRLSEAPEADVMVVTAVNDFEAIEKRVREQGVTTKCISLEGLVLNSLS